MSIAKVTEIIASSEKSFDDAIAKGIKRANKTIKNVTSVWIDNQSIDIKNGKAASYRVSMKVTFVLKD